MIEKKDFNELKDLMNSVYKFTINEEGRIEAPDLIVPECVKERVRFFSKYFEDGMTFFGGLQHVLAIENWEELKRDFSIGAVEDWLEPTEEFIGWRDQIGPTDMVIASALIFGIKEDEEQTETTETKSKLQLMRESKGLSVQELAKKAHKSEFGTSIGTLGHFINTIVYIETGIPQCPKPRKSMEYKALAKALCCHVDHIYGIKEVAENE